jgi:hypothetical protein
MEVEEGRQRLAGVETAAKIFESGRRAAEASGEWEDEICGLWGTLEEATASDSDGLDGWMSRSVARRALGTPGGSVYSSAGWVPPASVCYGDTPHAMLTDTYGPSRRKLSVFSQSGVPARR